MSNQISIKAALILLISVSCANLLAQGDVGPKVGSTIENFSLSDQDGTAREFAEFLKSGPVAVVFHRSADW